MTRRKPGETHEGYLPEEKLSRLKRLVYLRQEVPQQLEKPMSAGSLREEFDADFTVLNTDLFEVEDEGIVDAKVVMTVVAGEIVYGNK